MLVTLLCIGLLWLYALWTESKKHQSVSLSAYTQERTRTVSTRTEPISESAQLMPPQLAQSEDTPASARKQYDVVTPQIAPLPPYGAGAIGAPGAWDGRDADGRMVSGQIEQATECLYSPDLTTPQLRAIVRVVDPCRYQIELITRGDAPPSEVLAAYRNVHTAVFPRDLRNYLEGDLWSTEDLEQLAPFVHTEITQLALYLTLKKRGSAVTLNLEQDHPKNRLIDEYKKTGQCELIEVSLNSLFCGS